MPPSAVSSSVYRSKPALPGHAASGRHLRRLLLGVLGFVLLKLAGSHALAAAPPGDGRDPSDVQRLVDDMKARLSIPEPVAVTIAPVNPLMVSVEREGADGAFRLSFEAGFLELLSGEDLTAVVAHELGHVWIFTHHPYLQTESLANEIAMRVVSRASLERVYEKVWKRTGSKGDIARFLQ